MGTKSIKKKFSFLLLNLSLIVPLSGCNFTIEPNISKPSNTTSEDISADEKNLPVAPCSLLPRNSKYNGSLIKVELKDFSSVNNSDVMVSYSTYCEDDDTTSSVNGAIDAGKYIVTASFTSISTGKKVYQDLKASLIIEAINYNLDREITIESNGKYQYQEGIKRYLKVTDTQILKLFEVTYDETNQGKTDVGKYSVEVSFTPKNRNYLPFKKTLNYSISYAEQDSSIILLNPYQDKDNSLVINQIQGGTLREYFNSHPEVENDVNKMIEVTKIRRPYADFSFSYNLDSTTIPSFSQLIGEEKTYSFNFIFPADKNISTIGNKVYSYKPYNKKKEQSLKEFNLDIVSETIKVQYYEFEKNSDNFLLNDVEFYSSSEQINIEGFYFDSNYQEEIISGVITPEMFDNESSSIKINSQTVDIFVKLK